MKFYLAGQTHFGNRGCEALVRGTTNMIRRHDPDAGLVCPSDDGARDGQQWPDAARDGIEFVPAPVFPASVRWWARANRLLPLEGMGFPKFACDPASSAALSEASALIMTGGDIITLDYGVMSLYQWCRFNENAMDRGVPAVLWAASVGPFSARPAVERVMARHLKRYAAITVRETASLNYLRSIGVEHARLVADPAFHLTPEPFDASDIVPVGERPLLGLNVSPLIRKFRGDEQAAAAMDREFQTFIAKVIADTELSVLLVPHVGNLDGSEWNSDWHYMKRLLDGLPDAGGRVRLAPAHLNAGQLKYLIAQCRYFIGARTHSTIAALSQGIPTMSIAYSVKAKGINQDLFGHLDYVLETPRVSEATLSAALDRLAADEASIRACLAERLPQWRERALDSVAELYRVARTPVESKRAA